MTKEIKKVNSKSSNGKNIRKINDPIFGLIELNKIESDIIDSPLFQRLRYLKQLSLTHYVYPSAVHNRFAHSLGVFHLTNEICKVLKRENESLFEKDNIKNLKMAALLHDIGHFPFSHATEYGKKKDRFSLDDLPFFFKFKHEDFGCYLIKNSCLNSFLEDKGYDPELICNLIKGDDVPDRIFNRIINSELDADRLDYILRDSNFTGVGFGRVNYEYLIKSFRNFENKKIVIDAKAIRDIEHLIIARFSLYDRVYTHKNISLYNYFLSDVAYEVIKNYNYPEFRDETQLKEILLNKSSSEKLFELSDVALFDKFRKIYFDLKEKGNNNKLKSDLETVLFRKKLFLIKKYPSITPKPIGTLELIKGKIQSLIDELNKNYPNSIYLDMPTNKFTKYIHPRIPATGLKKEDRGKSEKEMEETIWIRTKKEDPEIFYMSQKSFFNEIKEFGIYKFLIYIKKDIKNLENDFEKIIPTIKRYIPY